MGWDARPDRDATFDARRDQDGGEKRAPAYHVLPNVLLPFDSARRRNCAALNCVWALATAFLMRAAQVRPNK